jgi:hypothetical protein
VFDKQVYINWLIQKKGGDPSRIANKLQGTARSGRCLCFISTD